MLAVTLYDARGVRDADKREAEAKFIAAFTQAAGGEQQAESLVAAAQAAWAADEDASDAFMAAIQAGESAAFEGWHNPGPAHFEFD